MYLPRGVSSDYAVFVVWELWMYVSSLYTIARPSRRNLVIARKNATRALLTYCFSIRMRLLSRIFLQRNASTLNMFNTLDACPLYSIVYRNFISTALTVGTLFSSMFNSCSSTHHTHIKIVEVCTRSGPGFISFRCAV
jgi:hypothetical protein